MSGDEEEKPSCWNPLDGYALCPGDDPDDENPEDGYMGSDSPLGNLFGNITPGENPFGFKLKMPNFSRLFKTVVGAIIIAVARFWNTIIDSVSTFYENSWTALGDWAANLVETFVPGEIPGLEASVAGIADYNVLGILIAVVSILAVLWVLNWSWRRIDDV